MNANLLKGKIKANGQTQEDVARAIGLSLSRFNAKLNATGNAEFSLGEVLALKTFFNLTTQEVESIFFD